MYCTLQEAWGDTFEKKRETFSNPKKKKKNIKKISFANDDLYNPYNENSNYANYQELNKNDNDLKDNYNFSRGIDRLPNTNGPKKRVNLPPIDVKLHDESETMYDTKDNEHSMDTELTEDNDYYNANEDVYDKNMINKKLNQIIQYLEKNNISIDDEEGEGNNINELILYIITGIFFIFILDTFVKIGKKLNI